MEYLSGNRSETCASKISISIIKDEDIIHKFSNFISFTGKLERIIKKEKYKSPFVSISFISKKIAKILEYYGANLRTSKDLV